jgi:GTP-binding protein
VKKPQAHFILSAPNADGLPDHDVPEIALAGRSNVGKSSLLGMLLGAPSLVRTSRTPGRTQLLNLFSLGDQLAFVDLPGYGYAKLSHTERARLSQIMRDYLGNRSLLRGVLLLLDARREEVAESDKAMAQFMLERGRPVLLVLTKADLVPKNIRKNRQRRLERSFGVPEGWSIMCSSKTREGEGELWQRLDELRA